ncbi:MAG: RNA polymerase sigma factor [Balneolales bacterium]|nr:RNA polymerase sigma factor [Balneolales bacterium]
MMKVKDGDFDKLGLLFERHNRALFSFFYRKTFDSQLSEDLVQSVFERMLKYRATYTGSGTFTTWMFSIARNAHIDHYRKEKRRKEDEILDEERIVADIPSGYAEMNERKKQKILLERALEQLTDDKKEVLILSRFEGLRYQEIAEIQGVSESAVKVRMFRAMKDLKEIVTTLSEEFSDE